MAIIDQIVSKLFDYHRQPYTREKLIKRCSANIKVFGINATEEFYIRGQEGNGTKKTRRLFSNGPVGNVVWNEKNDKFLCVEFYSRDLLLFVDAIHALETSVYEHLTTKTDINLNKPSIEDIVILRSLICDTEIDNDVLDDLLEQSRGNGFLIVCGLLTLARVAQSKQWMSITKNNWANKSFLSSKIEKLSFPSRKTTN
jgi:hypothetical protein